MVLPLCEWDKRGIGLYNPPVSGAYIPANCKINLCKYNVKEESESGELTSGNKLSSAEVPEQIVWDLRVGHHVRRFRIKNEEGIKKENLSISPHECCSIETLESIVTPTSVFGTICCKRSISSNGLWIANAKVDPNYGSPGGEGSRLWITVINPTDRTIILKKEDAFCSLYFQCLSHEVHGARRSVGGLTWPKRGFRDFFKDAFRHPFLVGVTVAIVSSVLTAVLTVKFMNDLRSSVESTHRDSSKPATVAPENDTKATSEAVEK